MLSFVNSHSNFNYYIVTIHILALDSQCRRNSSSRIRFRRQSSSLETCNMLIIIYNYIKVFFFTICITGQSRICNNQT